MRWGQEERAARARFRVKDVKVGHWMKKARTSRRHPRRILKGGPILFVHPSHPHLFSLVFSISLSIFTPCSISSSAAVNSGLVPLPFSYLTDHSAFHSSFSPPFVLHSRSIPSQRQSLSHFPFSFYFSFFFFAPFHSSTLCILSKSTFIPIFRLPRFIQSVHLQPPFSLHLSPLKNHRYTWPSCSATTTCYYKDSRIFSPPFGQFLLFFVLFFPFFISFMTLFVSIASDTFPRLPCRSTHRVLVFSSSSSLSLQLPL